jgi:hypothetical protein
MRPQSIVMFERLFLASLVLSVLSYFLSYDALVAQIEREPGATQLGLGGGFLIGSMVVGIAIYLLLWFLIARKASSVAKWILVVFVALGLAFSVPAALAGPWDLALILGFVVYGLEVAALVYLFQSDAAAWFRGETPSDPAAFD